MTAKRPAKNPCGSCPYRKDVPSGVWVAEEYDKLPPYDNEDMSQQPAGIFLCHQQDGHICAGWAGCHNMENNLALRLAVITGTLSGEEADATYDYVSPVPLWSSGREAFEHGIGAVDNPDDKARRLIQNLTRKQARRREK